MPPFSYDLDPTLRRLHTEVLTTGMDGGRPWARTADTLFYPEGGGQPADRGTLGGAAVLDVQKGPEGIRHILSHPVAPGPVLLELDWERRFDHMQQHTGQHLLTALAQDRFGWATTAFHLGATTCDVELDAPAIAPEQLLELEEALASAIREARPVSWRRVSVEDYGQEQVRSRGLPEGHTGDIRLVGIEGLDLNTCGGTHVASTAELELVKLLGTESIRGGTRLFYVAGGRARRRMEAHERRNLALRTLLGAPDEGLMEAATQKLEALNASERRARHLEEALAEAMVEALGARPGSFLEAHLEGRDLPFLQKVGRSLVASSPGRLVFLTAEGAFVLAAGETAGADLPAAGKAVAELLEGKGGGAKGLFQGKAGSMARRAEALEVLRPR